MELSERILFARKAKGLSRVELAKIVNVHFSMIGNYERGESTPAADTLGKLGVALEVSVDYLLNITPVKKIDGDIRDEELFALFSKIDRLPNYKKYLVKCFINAFVFKTEIEQQLEDNSAKHYSKKIIDSAFV